MHQIVIYILLRGTRILFYTHFLCFWIPSLWLVIICICPFGIQGRSRRLKTFSSKQDMGDTEVLLCPCVPQSPAQFQPPFFELLNLEGNRCWTRKGITFWIERLIINLAKELSFRGTWFRSLGWEDPLEEGMTTHSSIPAWRIPWTEPGELQSIGSQRAGHYWSGLTHICYLIEKKNT